MLFACLELKTYLLIFRCEILFNLDDAKDDPIELRLKVKDRNAARVERDLFKHFESSDPGPWQSTMVYGHMGIENVFSGSCLMLRKTIN